MKKLVLFALACACSFSQLIAQPKLIEKVTKQSNEVVIPYDKYVLPNGLTIVIHEDHSDPAVYVDVTYHVGSAREEIGRSGFAHFFEHGFKIFSAMVNNGLRHFCKNCRWNLGRARGQQ